MLSKKYVPIYVLTSHVTMCFHNYYLLFLPHHSLHWLFWALYSSSNSSSLYISSSLECSWYTGLLSCRSQLKCHLNVTSSVILPWLPKLPYITITFVILTHVYVFNIFIPGLNLSSTKTEISFGMLFNDYLVLEQSLTNSKHFISWVNCIFSKLQQSSEVDRAIISNNDKVGITERVSVISSRSPTECVTKI